MLLTIGAFSYRGSERGSSLELLPNRSNNGLHQTLLSAKINSPTYVIGNDGISFYILTDSVGTTSGPSAGATSVTDAGRILEFNTLHPY